LDKSQPDGRKTLSGFFLERQAMENELPADVKAMILDMDGVLWRDQQALLDMPAFFGAVYELGIPVVFATNNGTRSVDMYVERLAGFGVTVEPWQVVNSAIATADFLARMFPQRGPVFTVAEAGVIGALLDRGFEPVTEEVEGILAVVAGMDRKADYNKLALATLLIREGTPFIGTNPDITFPTPRGLVPGAGAFLTFLEVASGVQPMMIGKPEPILYQFSMDRLGTLPHETLAVGDRLETDILGGQRAGCPTVLVLSGVTTAAQAAKWTPPPDLVLPNLADLLPLLARHVKSKMR
jgi:4-nitrophenyl phosphatase